MREINSDILSFFIEFLQSTALCTRQKVWWRINKNIVTQPTLMRNTLLWCYSEIVNQNGVIKPRPSVFSRHHTRLFSIFCISSFVITSAVLFRSSLWKPRGAHLGTLVRNSGRICETPFAMLKITVSLTYYHVKHTISIFLFGIWNILLWWWVD